tara:strand:+ start:3410 stop:3925 length:516 start_codon:yes stop_codon:yes gene_type:complete
MKYSFFFLRSILKKKLSKIKLIVSDVDGVLTNGHIGYAPGISGFKLFNVQDGLAVKLLKSNGINLALISGGDSEATNLRAKSLFIDECHTNIEDKLTTLRGIQNRLNIPSDYTLYIGDDINDLEVLSEVALFAAPNDCNYKVKRKADLKLKSKGGEGVLREICDIILNIKN